LGLLFGGAWFGLDARRPWWLLPILVAGIPAGWVLLRRSRGGADGLEVIREIEPDQPALRQLWVTAAEQRGDGPGGELGFLQRRVVESALAGGAVEVWEERLEARLSRARRLQGLSACLLAILVVLIHPRPGRSIPLLARLAGGEVTVTPGDVEVERGSSLVVTATFTGAMPPEALLVLNPGTPRESRISMSRRLADPVFGTGLPEVKEPGSYCVEYGTKRTRVFRLSVFDFPALVRADASLVYPVYTGLTNRLISDTLRVTAVEGTHLSYALQLNKPMARAVLVSGQHVIPLAPGSNALYRLPDFLLSTNGRFSLQLKDADGRTNKFPVEFVFQALTNQRPQIRVVSPRGDHRVSALEEMEIRAEASDDLGLLAYGVGLGMAGAEPQLFTEGTNAPALAKRAFSHQVSLEKLGVEPSQSLIFFAWADDYGPDGVPRRTFSDMYFADVRPFEEVFRQDQSGAAEGAGQPGGGQGAGQGGGGAEVKLAEIQKQIVIATWNLQREKGGTKPPHRP